MYTFMELIIVETRLKGRDMCDTGT